MEKCYYNIIRVQRHRCYTTVQLWLSSFTVGLWHYSRAWNPVHAPRFSSKVESSLKFVHFLLLLNPQDKKRAVRL